MYVQSDTLFLVDVFENFKCMCLILQKKNSAPGLAWQAALKSTKVKLDLLADFDSYEHGNKSASRNDKLDLAV